MFKIIKRDFYTSLHDLDVRKFYLLPTRELLKVIRLFLKIFRYRILTFINKNWYINKMKKKGHHARNRTKVIELPSY